MKIVRFTPEKLEQLKAALEKAQTEGKGRQDAFTFDGVEYTVGYAGYLIDHLEATFSREQPQ